MSKQKFTISKDEALELQGHCPENLLVCGHATTEPIEGDNGPSEIYLKSGNGTEFKLFVNNNGELKIKSKEESNNWKD